MNITTSNIPTVPIGSSINSGLLNLYTSIYPEKNPKRMAELRECLVNNAKVFDVIWLIAELDENGKLDYLPDVSPAVINVLSINCRPTFRTMFNAVNNLSGNEDINVVANSDIYFKDRFKGPMPGQSFALTRYEGDVFLNRRDSQDAWVFSGKINVPKYCDFHIGVPGCDNRLARELSVAGYQVLNPSLTIKTYHLHKGQKSYDNTTRRVPPPYLRLDPISI
jgi:hypothetical protein